jgi:competence protein ComEA
LRRDPRAGIAALLVCALAAGAFWFRSSLHGTPSASAATSSAPRASSSSPSSAPPASGASTTSTTLGGTVVVHIAGAVVHPGVVTLRAGSRVIDGIRAAGGARSGADLDRLDLAARLTDGTRVAVPMRGQPAPALDADPSSSTNADGAPAGPVNLNTATEQQLETLPGIGPTLAAAIIAERDRSGGFKSINDLRRVHGIGDARFAQLQPLVAV